jgi:energy-coupling factor transporter ATP-binding protein EcfA2
MYLSSFHAKNLKCFQDVSLSFPQNPDGSYAGWNVLLGVNGTGKSTLLQAMALTLVGPTVGRELLRLGEREKWVRSGTSYAYLESKIISSKNNQDISKKGRPRKSPYPVQMYVTSRREVEIEGESFYQPEIHIPAGVRKDLLIGPYSEAGGWFTAGYGPFRRLSGGGSEEDQRLAWQAGSAGRLVTLFRESAALTRCENWLVSLQNIANDPTHS